MSGIAAGIRSWMMKIENPPEVPAPTPQTSAPPVPTQSDADKEVQAKKDAEKAANEAETKRRGNVKQANKTLLTSGQGDTEEAPVQRKTLLGGR